MKKSLFHSNIFNLITKREILKTNQEIYGKVKNTVLLCIYSCDGYTNKTSTFSGIPPIIFRQKIRTTGWIHFNCSRKIWKKYEIRVNAFTKRMGPKGKMFEYLLHSKQGTKEICFINKLKVNIYRPWHLTFYLDMEILWVFWCNHLYLI